MLKKLKETKVVTAKEIIDCNELPKFNVPKKKVKWK